MFFYIKAYNYKHIEHKIELVVDICVYVCRYSYNINNISTCRVLLTSFYIQESCRLESFVSIYFFIKHLMFFNKNTSIILIKSVYFSISHFVFTKP